MGHGGKRNRAGRPPGKTKFNEQTKAVRLPISLINSVLEKINKPCQIPLYASKVSAGFPSPADDYIERHLDLNEYLIKHPAATFFIRAIGKSMINAGIHENDILIVDRSITPHSGKIVVAVIDGQLTVKRLYQEGEKLILMPENPDFKPIEIKEGNEVYIWGVVTNVIHSVS